MALLRRVYGASLSEIRPVSVSTKWATFTHSGITFYVLVDSDDYQLLQTLELVHEVILGTSTNGSWYILSIITKSHYDKFMHMLNDIKSHLI